MTVILRPVSAAVAASLLLASCASIASVPAGPVSVGSAQAQLGREWSDITLLTPDRSKKVKLLTIDGPLLNRLYISDGLAPGDYIVRASAKERPTPTIRSGMSASERMEFVADSLAAGGLLRVETSRPAPATIDGHAGVRFDISAKSAEGLDIAGVAVAVQAGDKTYVAIFVAPAEHYFAALLPEAERVFSSLKLKS
ncbi:hypothetical protein [Phenylobacterium sp.]|uniref:hypothetical protein n=1 Tax=Phenylobacterium sp. TaxID=1871053 RepID=UPI002FDA7BD0